MIDFSGYTREQIQKEMLSQVPKTIDTRQGSLIQTALGPVALVSGRNLHAARENTAECLR